MVFLSLTISISRRPSSSSSHLQNAQNITPPPSGNTHSRTQSLCPSYTNSLSPSSLPTYKSSTRRESVERLLDSDFERREIGGSRKRVSVIEVENGRLKRRILSMDGAGSGNGVEVERKKSYGIGGAGNIRRPSDVIYPIRTNADGTRRRSSVWSSITPGTSPEGKKSGFWGLFRRGSAS